MIIFNTTYHVALSQIEPFLSWIRAEYIPMAMQDGILTSPRLAHVLTEEKECEGESYSLQFHVRSNDELMEWYNKTGVVLARKQRTHFGEEVLGFTTLLEELEIGSCD